MDAKKFLEIALEHEIDEERRYYEKGYDAQFVTNDELIETRRAQFWFAVSEEHRKNAGFIDDLLEKLEKLEA